MRVDVMTAGRTIREVATLATAAEAAGLHGIVITEGGRSAYLSATAAALATTDLEIGTGVAVAFPRSPMVTASTAWELAELSGGRFHLGLGTQVRAHIERRYSSEFDHPGPRMRDYVLAVRDIFAAFQREAPLDHHGEFYELTLLPEMWSPGPIDHPDVPVLLAAVGPWMTRMAGEVADGAHVHPLHSPTYLREHFIENLALGAESAGRSRNDLTTVVPVFTAVADTAERREALRMRARLQIGFYGSTRNYAHMFDMLGFDGTSARLNERLKAGDFAGLAEVITDEMLEHFAVTCTWDELAERLQERYSGLADRLVLYFAEDMEREEPGSLDRFGEVARFLEDT